ncbi:MAG: xylulokinase [Solobacterium sp.]|nr:xylulokinase [Solobacterium sp.]
MFYIGIDLGTTSVKLLLVDDQGKVVNIISKDYPLSFPHPGWSEQNPEDWWKQTVTGLRELTTGIDTSLVRGIGYGGQMHGLVILDENDDVIRPCILWNDNRTAQQTDWLNNTVGKETLSHCTANIAFAGFTAPKLLWLRENEPASFMRIKRIMLPKDYINYKLTGVHCTDYSDASGTLLLDVEHKCWSEQMCRICSVQESWLPKLYESYEPVGKVINDELPFLKDVVVAAGAGDNAAAAIGTNTLASGTCNISLGTSGTIFIANDDFSVDPGNSLHSFAHASGRYHLMGCILSAASANKWFLEDILGSTDYAGILKDITDEKLGNGTVYFLPYLMGERSPLNDSDARACFVGMDMTSTKAEMDLAVLEGVAFAFRDCLEAAGTGQLKITASTLCGGGAKSALWRRIIANVLNIRIDIPAAEEGPGYGGALLAMTAAGEFTTIQECAAHFSVIHESVIPNPEIAARYEKKYWTFRKIYPALKEIFKEL